VREVFISYARPDLRRVEALAQRLQRLVDSVWFDSKLHGGEDWWAGILKRIRESDIFLAVVSSASLGSEACRIERAYAAQVGRTIVPVALEAVPPALPSDIATLQIVDFSKPGEQSLSDLARALLAAPLPEPLPTPLPPDPEVPLSYLTDLVDRVNSGRELTKSEQMEIIFRLERGLTSSDQDEREGAQQVLERMRSRDDLAASVEKTIDLLAREHTPKPRLAQTQAVGGASTRGAAGAQGGGVGKQPARPGATPPATGTRTQGSRARESQSQRNLAAVLAAIIAVGAGLALAVRGVGTSLLELDWGSAEWLEQARSAYSDLPEQIAQITWVVLIIIMLNSGVAAGRTLRTRNAMEAAVATLSAAMRALPLVVLWAATAVLLEQSQFISYAVTMVIATSIGLASRVLWTATQDRGPDAAR